MLWNLVISREFSAVVPPSPNMLTPRAVSMEMMAKTFLQSSTPTYLKFQR
jgi:hypothetical protein